MLNLFPKNKIPYLVWSPPWTHISSGVRTLHLLVHALNESGEKAYIVPSSYTGFALNPELNTPLLSIQHQNFYGDNFIAVYSDVVLGNPFNAKHVVRMLLAPRGIYGGDKEFPETDQIWGALPSIADNVLRIPVNDPTIFFDAKLPRSGSCFYAHKYDKIHGNELLPVTDGMTRLEGNPSDIAGILQRSEVCYLYELTAAITEAALCNCPVKLIRTPYFNKIDPACMMGNVRWNDGEIVSECTDYSSKYEIMMHDFPRQLANFIEKTQVL